MGLIADVVDSVKAAFRQQSEENDQRRTLKDSDIPLLKQAYRQIFDELTGLPGIVGGGVGPDEGIIRRLGESIQGSEDTVAGLENRISLWIASELEPVLNVTLINRSEDEGGSVADPLRRENVIAGIDKARAINGAALATSLVVALNMAAAALDGGTQVLTLGQIQGWQDLVRNITWSTGLADLGGLSFRPQISASFGPLLDRHYNSLAQAQIPGSGDLIRFLVREVFEQDRRTELDADNTPEGFIQFMQERGFSEFWSKSYWAAHWAPLTTTQLNEMLYRGVIPQEEWDRQQIFNDFLPQNLDWLRGITFETFTRVDARRMADLGLLNDQQLLQAYADIGYFAPKEGDVSAGFKAQFVSSEQFDPTTHKAQALVIFTRVFNAMPSIRRRLSNGWLRADQVQGEIANLGVPESTAVRLTRELVDAEQLGEAEETRSLTQSQIVRGAKGGLLSFDQAMFLLRQLGYSEPKAELLLRLRITPEDAATDTGLGETLINAP